MMATHVPVYSVDPATGQTIVTRPDGTVELVPQPGQTYTPREVTNADPRIQGGTVPVTAEPAPEVPAQSQSGARYDASSRSGNYGARGGSRYSGGGSGGGYSPTPRYADGTTHPSAYGDQRDLAGLGDRIRQSTGAAPGTGYRPQVYVPGTGANAGPFGANPPSYEPRPALPDYGGSSGGGGGRPDLGARLAQAKGRIQSALGSAGLGGGASYGGSTAAYGATPPPAAPKMRGLAKGMDPTQAAEVAFRPTVMLPEVMPGLGGETPLYQSLAAMPAAQWGMLSRRGYDGSASDLVNAVGRTYQKIGENNWLPSFDRMFANLSDPKQGAGIDTLFQGERAGRGDAESYTAPGYVYGKEPLPLGLAATTYGGMLDAALAVLPAETAAKYSTQPGGYGSYLLDKWGSKALKRPAGKGQSVNQFIGRRLMR